MEKEAATQLPVVRDAPPPLLPPEQPRTIPLQKRQHLLEMIEVIKRSEDGKTSGHSAWERDLPPF